MTTDVPARPDPGAAFAKLRDNYLSQPDVTSHGKGFGATALKVDHKIFVTLTPRHTLILKLPAERVDELVTQGLGQHFETRPGRLMKEWLELDPSTSGKWKKLTEEALAFARRNTRAQRPGR